MINRENWLDVREYLDYLQRIGLDAQSVDRAYNFLRHFLEWADERPFGLARNIDPGFQTYIATARNDTRQIAVSPSSIKKGCEAARRFLLWAREAHPLRYKRLSAIWIDTIRPGTARSMHSRYQEPQYYTIQQVQAIAQLEPRNLREERDIAAVCFLFISAMRISAFVSLPIKAINLEALTVDQFPELGVRTKNGKAERTHLLPVRSLLDIVRAWDAKLRADGRSGNDLWYPKLDSWNRGIIGYEDTSRTADRRNFGFANGLRNLCARAGVPYMSPHKLRDGHAVYVYPKLKTMDELKKLSRNMMHDSVITTDKHYGRIVNDEVGRMYRGLEE